MLIIFCDRASSDVREILVAGQLSSEEWQNAIWSGSCPDLKGEDYEHGVLYVIGLHVKDFVFTEASV
jgi:hypothetical protein